MREEHLRLRRQIARRLRRHVQIVDQLAARDVAEQDRVAQVGDHRESTVWARRQDLLERLDRVAGGGEDRQILDPRHHLARGDVGDGKLLAVVQERVFVEMDPALVDAALAEGVPYPFADHHRNHDGEDVGQRAGELEHDDNDGHGHACDTAEGGGSPDDGVGAGDDAGDVGFAG